MGVAYERMCLPLPSFLQGSADIRAKWLREEYFTIMDSAIQEWEDTRRAANAPQTGDGPVGGGPRLRARRPGLMTSPSRAPEGVARAGGAS